ncbi:hypothetical protein PUR71_13500 [Streptomyces sp. SP17BM10]|uniref:hypothetical protein n=1 Tax=Streptomyces sp. SP17BM10 TaxID=3002530 RepID=UPI002E775CC6|nr:hypothetical protein [Streptomyces sp. SP17BM10]MEE1783917.1 hypothetical protein [Streptomyces sp. SP17BM10]
MTDKFPRRIGGDGDGPAETPTERLLREAMTARTSLITAHDLRPAAPPDRRIRRLRPVYAVTLPLLGLAAAMAVGVVTLHGNPVADHEHPPPAATVSASPSPTSAATPTGTPSPTATPTETATPTDTATPDDPETAAALADETPTPTPTPTRTTAAKWSTVNGVKFKVPAGWRIAGSGPQVCVLSPGAPQDADEKDCKPYGVALSVFDEEAPSWPSVSALDESGGWGSQPNCPIWGNPHPPAADEPLDSVGPTKSTPTVAGRPALKSQWQVTCGKSAFTAQLWALPKDQVFVSAIGLKSDYQADLMSIVNSLDVSGHRAPYSDRVGVSVSGVGPAQQLPNDGTPLEFSVTFKNTGSTKATGAKALVFGDHYPGVPVGQTLTGTLERQEGAVWKSLDFRRLDSGFSALETGLPLDLDPGQSVTVNYRLKLAAQDGPGALPLTARLAVPTGDSFSSLGETQVQVQVTAK